MSPVHFSGEISLGTIVSLVALLSVTAGLAYRLGQLRQAVENLIESHRDDAKKLDIHIVADEQLFRELTASLNLLAGRIRNR